jgi:LPS-assembly protein
LPRSLRFAPPIVIRRIAPLTVALLVAISGLRAADAPALALTALKNRTSREGSVFTGDARLAYEGVVITADEILYVQAEHLAIARGNVILTRGDQRLVAETIRYHLDTRTFTAGRFRVGQQQVLAEGAGAAGTPQKLEITQADVTLGEPDPLNPHIRSGRMSYEHPDNGVDQVSLEQNRLAVGSVPLIRLPAFHETPSNPSLSGFEILGGTTGQLGTYLDLTVTSPVAPDVALGGEVGVFSRRGVILGPVVRYDTFGPDGRGAKGALRSGFIQDQGNTGLDIIARPIDNSRGYVDWEHQQVIAPGLTFAGRANYWSDSEITRDFRRGDFNRVQTPDNWLETDHTSDNFVVSAFTRVRTNDFSVVQERLPEVRFDGFPVEIGAGIYHRLNAGVALLRENPVLVGPTITSQRADLYYGVSRPFSPREWFSLTPVAGARITHYADTAPGSLGGAYTRTIGEIGFDAKAFEHSATWDYQNQRWGINGLRHIATPSLSYRFSPAADNGRTHIPVIDDDVFNTYLRPLGIADQRNIDQLPATDTLRLGYDHVLQTRDKVYGSRDLARLNLAVDEHISADAARSQGVRRDRTDAHAFLELTPIHWLRYDLYDRTTLQTGKTRELNTGLTLRDADIWSLRLGSDYLYDPIKARAIEQYTLDFTRRFNEIYSGRIQLRYDYRDGVFTEQNYILRQRLSRLWLLSYVLSLYDGNGRDGNYGFTLRVETTRF